MKGDHERGVTNSEQLHALRDLFDSEIRRVDAVLTEREKESARSMQEALRAREAANEWRQAMNDREQHYTRIEAHDLLQAQVDRIIARQDEGRGRQAAWIAAAGIIATLIAIGVGQIIRQTPTSSDISQQIQREAPWNRDKQGVERRITILEAQIQRLQLSINKLQGDLKEHEIRDTTGGK